MIAGLLLLYKRLSLHISLDVTISGHCYSGEDAHVVFPDAKSLSHILSAALSVKMSALLYLPGVLVILFLRRGLFFTIRKLVTMVGLQILVAMPFLREDWQTYLHSAFEFSRVFLYKWTVNWRFIPEDIFLSPQLAKGLLLGHVSVLVCFGLFRWCNNDGGVWSVLERGLRRPHLPAALVPLSADCGYPLFLLTYPLTIHRCRDGPVHFESDRHIVRSLPTLSVLLLVRASDPSFTLEDSISSGFQVSLSTEFEIVLY